MQIHYIIIYWNVSSLGCLYRTSLNRIFKERFLNQYHSISIIHLVLYIIKRYIFTLRAISNVASHVFHFMMVNDRRLKHLSVFHSYKNYISLSNIIRKTDMMTDIIFASDIRNGFELKSAYVDLQYFTTEHVEMDCQFELDVPFERI